MVNRTQLSSHGGEFSFEWRGYKRLSLKGQISFADTRIHETGEKQRKRPKKSEVNRLLACNKKAKKLLKWKPQVSFEEGLTMTVDWMKSNKPDYATPFKGWPKANRMKLSNWVSSGYTKK